MSAIGFGIAFGAGVFVGFLSACIIAVETCKIMDDEPEHRPYLGDDYTGNNR
jgi:hypothetical protein